MKKGREGLQDRSWRVTLDWFQLAHMHYPHPMSVLSLGTWDLKEVVVCSPTFPGIQVIPGSGQTVIGDF